MNESNIFVKEKQADLFTKGFILLSLIVASLICCFAPVLFNGLINSKFAFYFIGGLLFALFATLFVQLLYREFHPNNVIIISSRGFVDKKNVGPDIEIEWTNVASVKLLGNQDMPFLGITLENCDIVMAKMKKRETDEMRENIDEGLPHILIAQNEIYTSVNELKDIFIRLIREARVLSNESNPKPKNNPFTTDDVLRAFGKLPPNDDSGNEPQSVNNEEINDAVVQTSDEDNFISSEPQDEESEIAEIHKDEENAIDDTGIGSTNSFYEVLKETLSSTSNDTAETKTSSEPKQDVNTEINSDTDFSDEINEFLSRAKSSKITELNKMLNEKEVPFSLSRDVDKTDSITESNEVLSDSDTDKSLSEEINEETNSNLVDETEETEENTDINYNKDFYIEFPSELYNETIDNNEVDFTFESLIQQTNEFDAIKTQNKEDITDSE